MVNQIMEIVKGGRKDLFLKKKKERERWGQSPHRNVHVTLLASQILFWIMDGQAEMDGWGQPEMFTLALLAPQILFK